MCDLLWSDPDDRGGWGISPRGAGYTFGQVDRKIDNQILIDRQIDRYLDRGGWGISSRSAGYTFGQVDRKILIDKQILRQGRLGYILQGFLIYIWPGRQIDTQTGEAWEYLPGVLDIHLARQRDRYLYIYRVVQKSF